MYSRTGYPNVKNLNYIIQKNLANKFEDIVIIL